MQIRNHAGRPRHSAAFCVVLVLIFVASGCTNDQDLPERLLSKAQSIEKKDINRAVELTARSASMNYIPAMIALGNYEAGGRLHPFFSLRFSESDTASRANDWYVRAAEALEADGSASSLSTLALMRRNGYGGPRDVDQAYELAFEAASLGQEQGLLFAAFWAHKDGDADRVTSMITRAHDEGYGIAYKIESIASAWENPDDVVGAAKPLARAEAAGFDWALTDLKEIAYSLTISADRGDSTAQASIASLKENDLWRQPEADFFPGKRDYSKA